MPTTILAPVPYADPPKPGTYFIASRAVKTNYLEAHPDNEARAFTRFEHAILLSAPNSSSCTVVEMSTQPTMWNLMRTHDGFADDVGGEIAETVEDQVNHLRNQVALRDAELAAKDQQLAQKERELQTLREHHQAELSKLKGDSGSVQHQALGDSFESMAILDEPKDREENNAR
ncbi:hypothetical protein RSOL_417170, partial [Rhizoctonia solani AG-3 Rhs1AP]